MSGIGSPKHRHSEHVRTNIAVNVEFNVEIVGPDDGIDPADQVLEEKPEAQKGDTEVPALTDEASQ